MSTVLANLVIEEVEKKAIATTPTAPQWWYLYVDESHSCIKQDKAEELHTHLNSFNPHIQFALATLIDSEYGSQSDCSICNR